MSEDILTDEGKIICELTNIFTNKNKEIDRLNSIITSLEKDLNEAYDALHRGELVNGRELINNIYQDIKVLKENK